MKLKISLIILTFMLLIISCSRRYQTFSRTLKKFEKGEISRIEYDSVIQTLYTIQKDNFVMDDRIKLSGAYVAKEYNDYYNTYDYRTVQFTDSIGVIKSYRFTDPLTNSTLRKTQGVLNRYSSKDGNIILENLLSRDFELYNIYRYAEISENGDTLTFFKTKNLQRPNEKKGYEKLEVYIYDSELTARPKLPK